MKYLNLVFFFLALNTMHISSVQAAIWGDEIPVGKGIVQTYVELDDWGEPYSLGVAFNPEALEGLPEEYIEYVLKLPDIDIPPFRHVTVNWNPQGHHPTEVYGAPHFDFHFFLIPRDVQKDITCMGDDKALCMKNVLPELIPSDYAPTPEGVPTMGWHWIDMLSGEWHGQPFTSTFIYGYYNGMQAFIEPMITRAFFLDKMVLDAPIRLPQKFSQSGLYPDSYSVWFDEEVGLYKVELKNLWWY